MQLSARKHRDDVNAATHACPVKVPTIIGRGGANTKSIHEETGCKVSCPQVITVLLHPCACQKLGELLHGQASAWPRIRAFGAAEQRGERVHKTFRFHFRSSMFKYVSFVFNKSGAEEAPTNLMLAAPRLFQRVWQ